MRNWLTNFPIPEYHVVFLVVGLALNFWPTATLSLPVGYVLEAAGYLFLALGLVISIWSTTSFGEDSTAQSPRLRVDGPYRVTRNPMYVGWTLLIIGVGLILGSWWLLGGALAATVVTHYRVVLGEEMTLLQKFGEEYEDYRSVVRRWLWPLS